MLRLAQKKLGGNVRSWQLPPADSQHSGRQIQPVVAEVGRDVTQVGAGADRGREHAVAGLDFELLDEIRAQLLLGDPEATQTDPAQQVIKRRAGIVNSAEPPVDARYLVVLDKYRNSIANRELQSMLAVDQKLPARAVCEGVG